MKWRHMLCAATTLTICPAPADAFSLRLHLYLAEQVFADLQDCHVDLGGESMLVPDEACGAIKAHEGAFLAGAIGPDAFPDLVVGQAFIHPGSENGRQAADWFDLLLERAETKEEIAFAYGNLMHAAGDIFAHSYVNNYAGGVFDITAFRPKDIERRHSQLEKYIDQRLDYDDEKALKKLVIPAGFLVDTMVRTSYVPMGHRLDIEGLQRLFHSPASEISKVIGRKMRASAPGGHMMTMWGLLAVAERERVSAPCREVAAVANTTEKLRSYVLAEHAARQADRARRGLDPLPGLVLPPAVTSACTPGDAPMRLEEAEALLADMIAQAGMATNDLTANRRKTWWKALRHKERRDLLKAMQAYEAAAAQREEARALRVFTHYWAGDVRTAIMRYMEASLGTAKDMVRSSRPYPPATHEEVGGTIHYKRWMDCYRPVFGGDPAEAAAIRCERLKELKTDMSLPAAARLAGMGEMPRSLLYEYLAFQHWLDKAMTDALYGVGTVVAPSLTELVKTLTAPKRIDRDILDRTFRRGLNGQVRFTCVSDFIDADLGLFPRAAEGEMRSKDSPCAMADEKTFAARAASSFDPQAFIPLKHAITLGKLALLDAKGVRTLAERLAPDLKDEIVLGDYRRYSVILDTARSLDGSYQWNGASMPYPRDTGHGGAPAEYDNGGYPERHSRGTRGIQFDYLVKERRGFPYYRTQNLRERVFRPLFREPFEGEILKAAEFNGSKYPFSPCPGDPFREGGRAHIVCATGSTAGEIVTRAIERVTTADPLNAIISTGGREQGK